MTEGSPSNVPPVEPGSQRGRTMADEELERVAAKSASGNVLDPLALQDPVGKTVEKAILRVGLVVVGILVVGLLVAQVACKNITIASVVNLGAGVTQESLDRALGNGVLVGNDIVKFSHPEIVAFDEDAGTMTIAIEDTRAVSIDELASYAMSQSFALATNAFQDPGVTSVCMIARAPVDAETGELSLRDRDELKDILKVTWTRSSQDAETFLCQIEGFDLTQAAIPRSLKGKELAQTELIPASEIATSAPAA